MNFWDVFEEVKRTFMSADISDYQGHLALQVNITGEGEGKFYAEIDNGTLSVEPYEYFDRDVMFTVNSHDFLKIIHGKMDPVFAFTVGKLKIDGDLGKALEIQRLVNKV
ncbi:MAG: SCP2 sterol-binding domain-containing protein [Acutalibacteraceae bacterium]|nr:SCP2 sterol-binding domain-containing protein [Acutalibacteraceae bacterium]